MAAAAREERKEEREKKKKRRGRGEGAASRRRRGRAPRRGRAKVLGRASDYIIRRGDGDGSTSNFLEGCSTPSPTTAQSMRARESISPPPERFVGRAKPLGRASAWGHVTVGDDGESLQVFTLAAGRRRRLTRRILNRNTHRRCRQIKRRACKSPGTRVG